MDHFAYEATSSSLCPPYKPMSRPLGVYTSKHRRGILRQHFRCVSFFRGEVWTHLTLHIPHPAVWPLKRGPTDGETDEGSCRTHSQPCLRALLPPLAMPRPSSPTVPGCRQSIRRTDCPRTPLCHRPARIPACHFGSTMSIQ